MRTLLLLLSIFSFQALADIAIDDLSKDDLKEVSNEIAVNFSHTLVAAPETNGGWGVEAGLVAGSTKSEKLAALIEDTGEDGGDYDRLPHGGLVLRGHVPFDIFLEASFIPSVDTNDIEASSSSFAAGWNFGGFFGWPLDVAIGGQLSKSSLEFDQTLNNASTGNTDVDSTIKFDTQSSAFWLGVSKTFVFITPYAKVGIFKSESEVEVDATGGGDIFSFSDEQKEEVDESGTYTALGANLQFFLFRLGAEVSSSAGVSRMSGKLSLAF